ncbi:hypothetical protein ACT3CE_09330 [Marinifilum sp. RC60d5]|uniref:hypothetical protein n=1 Tax=Marinifilum sp. RC60d5 TaxID=3458414 RepID=UPI0040353726
MKKSEIIDLSLKLFGINVIITALLYFKDIHYLKSMFTPYNSSSIDYLSIILFFAGALITFLIGYVLIFKSSSITKRIIKEDTIINLNFDTNYKNILDVSLVIIGISILIFQLSNFISTIIRAADYFIDSTNINHYMAHDISILLQYILGYILITNSRNISRWIIKINQKNTKPVS